MGSLVLLIMFVSYFIVLKGAFHVYWTTLETQQFLICPEFVVSLLTFPMSGNLIYIMQVKLKIKITNTDVTVTSILFDKICFTWSDA